MSEIEDEERGSDRESAGPSAGVHDDREADARASGLDAGAGPSGRDAGAGPSGGDAAAGASARDADRDDRGLSSADYTIAFTPRNVAVGLAIVAGLVAFVASRRRRRRDEDA